MCFDNRTSSYFFVYVIFVNFLFQNTYSSQEVVKKCTGRARAPFTKFSQMVTYSINTVQCHNQEIDISTIHRAYSDFIGYRCTCVCVWGGGARTRVYSSVQFYHT